MMVRFFCFMFFIAVQPIFSQGNNDFELVKTDIINFFKTGIKSPLRSYQLPHVFRENMETAYDNEEVCYLCHLVFDLAIDERRHGSTRDQLVEAVEYLCISLGIENERVCQGAIDENADILIYIIDNYSDIKAERFCGSVLQSFGCPTGDQFEWSVDIPPGNAVERNLDQSAESFNILQLSDIHYDPNYKPGGVADCGEPVCCQDDQGEPSSLETACGYWTDYRDADVPWHLVEETIRQTKTQEFDYVYYTGDIISHRVWQTSVENNTKTILKLYSFFKDSYNVSVFPIFGNHEPHPLNVWPDDDQLQDETLSVKWLFALAAEEWSQLIGEDISETVLKGGYYSVTPRRGFRIIGLNGNLCYTDNWWLIYDDVDPFNQLQWLADTLKQAEEAKESVHILSHVPTGDGSCLKVWSREYRRIVERFSTTISGQFNGHTHRDEFHVYYNNSAPNQAIGVAFNGASVTPYSSSNPSYKIYNVDDNIYFVAHSNVQQLLASIWYEGLPGFRRKNMVLQALEIVKIGILFPFFSTGYIVAPHSVIGQTMRKPFIKFICNSASYITFLFMLSQTLFFDDPSVVYTQRGAYPTLVEWIILAYVLGLIWSEIKQLWDVGLEEYVRDMWNVIDFITNSLYVATVALRVVSIYQVHNNPIAANVPREDWDAWDPMLISEGLFSAANIFSSLKLVHIFSVNPHLGPLQVSLSRMVMDIMKFFFLYVLVLFAFSCGLNQLLSYYAEAERRKCPDELVSLNLTANNDTNACIIWRRFSNLFETSQTLFWAVFGLVDLESFELNEIKIFTRFWGMLMFGTYSVINIVVLLNLLIAMMNHSYQLISERADVEWKFARSKLWISYFEEGGTAPPPFNIIPTPKSLWYVIQWVRRKFCGHSRAAKKEHMRTIRRKVKQASERDFRYQSIMRNLVRRYVTVEQRKAENQGVTEDDVNEIKQDISAFRFELIEILKNSGMNTSTAHSGMGTGGKKNRQKERRLMKGFNIGPQPSTTSGPLPPVAEFIASLQHQQEGAHHHDFFGSTLSGIFNSTPRKLHQHSSTVSSSQGSINEGLQNHNHTHRGIGRFHLKRSHSHKRRWGTLIEAAKTGKVSRLIGRSRSEDSVCNNCRENGHNHSHSHSNSPASDENGSVRSTDSNPSLDVPVLPEPELRGLAHGLALLKKKRKKYSASRNTSPIVPPANREVASVKKPPKKIPLVLKRASSVPTRVPEVVQLSHGKIQSQQDSVEIPISAPPTLTPSTTEESVTAVGQSNAGGASSREPLLYYSSSSNQATGSSQTPEEEFKASNSHSLPKLPGVIPLSGHNGPAGWL